MKSLTELRRTSLERAANHEPGEVQELYEICSELVQQIEALQRQIDEMRRHQNIARRSGG
jgi:hypothetical protein